MELFIASFIAALVTWIATIWYFHYQRPKIIPISEILENLERGPINKKELQRLTKRYYSIISSVKRNSMQPEDSEEGIPLDTLASEKRFFIIIPRGQQNKSWFRTNMDTNEKNLVHYNASNDLIFYINKESEIKEEVDRIFTDFFSGVDQVDLEILKKYGNKIKNERLHVILSVNHIIFKNSTHLNRFYEYSKTSLASKIPNGRVILEVSLSSDLIDENRNAIINHDFCIHNEQEGGWPKVADYIISKNLAFKKYSSGGQFGNILQSEYQIPEGIIETICSEKNINNTKWKILNIYGSPGSGKSELLKFFLENVFIKDESIKIVLNADVSLTHFSSSGALNTEEGFINGLLETLSDPNHNFLIGFDKSEESLLGAKDALMKIMLSRTKDILLVIDDYHIRKETFPIIDKIIEKNWNLKLLLAGRPKYKSEDSGFMFLETKLWSREEASLILNYWLPDNADLIRDSLGIRWVYDEEKYSTYLLRIIKNHTLSIKNNATSATLLYQEIKSILSPVFNELSREISNKSSDSASELLELYEKYIFNNTDNISSLDDLRAKIKREKGKIHREFDLSTFINDLGLLSMTGRLSNGDKRLSLDNIVKMSRVIRSNQESEIFLKSGSEAGIFYPFDPHNKSCEWKDSLVADGCLALRLNFDLGKIAADNMRTHSDVRPFLVALQQLKEKNSTYILKLALDETSLNDFIKTIIKHDIDLADIIYEDLLTDSFLNRIKQSDMRLNELFETVINNIGSIEKEESFLSVARILARIIDADERFESRINELLPLATVAGKTAIATTALITKDKMQYFKKSEDYGLDKETSLVIALQVWELGSTAFLIDKIKEFISTLSLNKKDKIRELWKNRLKNKTPEDVKSILEQIISYAISQETQSELILIILEETFLKIKQEGKRSILTSENYFKDRIQFAIEKLKSVRKFQTLSKLIKWLVYFTSPDLFREKIEWEFIPSGSFAIPKKQYDDRNITDILNIIPENSNFSIPGSNDILQLKDYQVGDSNLSFIKGSLELVSDRFPIGFQYKRDDYEVTQDIHGHNTIRLQATQVAIWDGIKKNNEVGFIDRKNQLTQKVKWRPKLFIP